MTVVMSEGGPSPATDEAKPFDRVPVKITEDNKADHKIDIAYVNAGRPLRGDAWMSKMIACWTHAVFPGCDTVLVIG
jgi:hypothetical protein